MKNTTQHTGTLRIIGRLPNSRNGNPRYLATVDGFVFRTKPDSSLAYALPNHEGKPVTATIGTYYSNQTLDSINA